MRHVIALSLALAASSALAARQPPITLDELIGRSGAVVEVRISEVDPTAGTGWPTTRVRYAIERHLSDTASHTSGDFLLPEGIEADGMTYSGYVGTPEFAPGETYLVFLRHAPWYISPITHWRSGHLRRVVVAGRETYVDAGGACVVEWDERVRFGPRIVDPPASPGRGARWSVHPPTPSAIGGCLPASEIRLRLRLRMRQLGWRAQAVPVAPIDGRPVVDVAELP